MAVNLGQMLVEILGKNDDAIKKMDETEGHAKGTAAKIAGALGKVAVGAAVGGVAALGAGMVGAIKIAGDYEATMNRFAAVTGSAIADAGLEIESFNALFLEMGAKTQFSAGEAAAAAVELAKGGIDPATIAAGGLEAALGLAAAGELDLAAAAEITAKQLGVWASAGVSAGDVANQMAQAANASTVGVDDLAIGMANVGGVAKVAGLSFQETTQAMAMLAPGFSSASDAGTSFKAFLNNMIPTTANAITAMTNMGLSTLDTKKAIAELSEAGIKIGDPNDIGEIEAALGKYAKSIKMTSAETKLWMQQFQDNAFFDAKGQFVGMEEAAKALHGATKDLTEQEKLMALETIFGSDAMRAAALIAEQGAEGYVKMGKAMDAAGSATEQAAQRNKGFAFAMESLKGSLETIAIVVGTKLLPPITTFLNDVIIPGANKVLAFATSFGTAGQETSGFGGIIEKISPIITGVQAAFQKVSDWIAANWHKIGPIVEDVLNGIVSFIKDPLTPILDAIVTLFLEIASAVVDNWPEIKAAADRVFNGISTLWLTLLKPAFDGIISLAEKIPNAIAESLTRLETNVNAIEKLFTDAFTAINLVWVTVFQPMFTNLTLAVNAIVLLVTTDFPKIHATITKVMNDVKAFIDETIASVKGTWESGWNQIHATLVSVFDKVFGFFKGMPAVFVQFAKDALQGFINGLLSMKDRVVSAFLDSLPGPIRDAMMKLFNFGSPSKVFYDFGVDTIQGFVDGMKSMADAPANAMADIARGLNLAPNVGGIAGTPGGAAALTNSGRVVNVTINNANTLASATDIDLLAYRIARRIEEY